MREAFLESRWVWEAGVWTRGSGEKQYTASIVDRVNVLEEMVMHILYHGSMMSPFLKKCGGEREKRAAIARAGRRREMRSLPFKSLQGLS